MLLKDNIGNLQDNTWYILHCPLYDYKIYGLVCKLAENGEYRKYIRYIIRDGTIQQNTVEAFIDVYPDMTATLVRNMKISLSSDNNSTEQNIEFENDLRG